MRDRRRVGLVDHSDQRDREKISRAVKEGFLSADISVAAAGSYFRNASKKPTYFGKARKLWSYAPVYPEAAPEGAADAMSS
jgi:hypothetical protein